MYIYVYIYIYIPVYIYIHIHTWYIYIYIYIHTYIPVYIYIYTYLYIYIHSQGQEPLKISVVPVGLNYFAPHKFRSTVSVDFGDPIEVCVYLGIYRSVCVYVCITVFVYVWVYRGVCICVYNAHTYIHTYTHTHTSGRWIMNWPCSGSAGRRRKNKKQMQLSWSLSCVAWMHAPSRCVYVVCVYLVYVCTFSG
jgi:hypothetical protein